MTTPKKTPKHKSPYWRPEKPQNIRETERVQQVCLWLWQHRLLTAKQWQRLLEASEPMVKRFLKRMYRAHYFDRFPYATESDGRNPALYILGAKGIDLLKRLGYGDISGIPSKGLSPFNTVPHTLAIADVRIAITKAIGQLGWELVEWRSEYHFQKDYDFVTLPGQRNKQSLRPDGFFVVRLPNKRVSTFFLEIDRATEYLKTFETKVRCYVEYHRSGQFTKRFGYKGFRMLTVVASPGRVRLRNLASQMGQLPNIQRRFWFTHLEDAMSANPLSDPIWEIAGNQSNAQLFDPNMLDE